MATDLIFNRNTDNYVFTGSRLRAPPSKALRLSVADNAGAYIDVSTNGTIDISAQAGVFVNGLRVVTTSSGATTALTGLQLTENLDVSGTITSEGGIQIGSGLYGGKIYKSLNPYELVIDPFGIDPSGNISDASGQVTIMGDLVVRGNTTTISSTNIDISDIKLTLASASGSDSSLGSGGGIELGNGYASMLWNSGSQKWEFNKGVDVSGALSVRDPTITIGSANTGNITGKGIVLGNDAYASMLWNFSTQSWTFNKGVDVSGGISTKKSTITLGSGNTGDFWHGGGILLGNDAYASMKWDYYTQRWSFNKGIDVSGGITIKSSMATTGSSIKIPTTLANFRVKYSEYLTESLDPSGIQATGVWHDISGWNITYLAMLSGFSRIKFEARIAFTSSPEADQTLSFRVLRLTDASLATYIPICTDLSLGSNMGVSINSVHNIVFYDRPATAAWTTGVGSTNGYATYKLQLMRNCPANDTISTPFGVQASSGNFMSVQEIYTPTSSSDVP